MRSTGGRYSALATKKQLDDVWNQTPILKEICANWGEVKTTRENLHEINI